MGCACGGNCACNRAESSPLPADPRISPMDDGLHLPADSPALDLPRENAEIGGVDFKAEKKVWDEGTPRRGPYVFPKRKAYPIGNETHGKLALIYSTWPDNKADAPEVRKKVFARYPELRKWFEDGKYEHRAESLGFNAESFENLPLAYPELREYVSINEESMEIGELIEARMRAAKEEGLEDWENDSNGHLLSGHIQDLIWEHEDFDAESFGAEGHGPYAGNYRAHVMEYLLGETSDDEIMDVFDISQEDLDTYWEAESFNADWGFYDKVKLRCAKCGDEGGMTHLMTGLKDVWDNVGYDYDYESIHCPMCGKGVELVIPEGYDEYGDKIYDAESFGAEGKCQSMETGKYGSHKWMGGPVKENSLTNDYETVYGNFGIYCDKCGQEAYVSFDMPAEEFIAMCQTPYSHEFKDFDLRGAESFGAEVGPSVPTRIGATTTQRGVVKTYDSIPAGDGHVVGQFTANMDYAPSGMYGAESLTNSIEKGFGAVLGIMSGLIIGGFAMGAVSSLSKDDENRE